MIRVQLWAGTIPYLKYVACHYWLEIFDGDSTTRWEVWQLKSQCKSSWGHLHQNLLPASTWLPDQHMWLEREWHQTAAKNIAATLANIANHYPHCHKYRYFPGPNSNSFIQYVLDKSGVEYQLPPFAIGKDHQKAFFIGKRNTSFHIYTPLFSLKTLHNKGVETTILGVCIGFTFAPFSIRLPFINNRHQ